MRRPVDPDILVGYAAIASFVGLDRRQVQHLALTGRLPVFTQGTRVVRARQSALEEWLKTQPPRDPDAIVGTVAIAAHLGCTPGNVTQLIATGALPVDRLDGRWVLSRRVLAEARRPDPDTLVGSAAIAAFLRRSAAGVFKLVRGGRLPVRMVRGRLTASRDELHRLFPTRRGAEPDEADTLRGRAEIAAFLHLKPASLGYLVRENSVPTRGERQDRVASRRELARLHPRRATGWRPPWRAKDSAPDAAALSIPDPKPTSEPNRTSLMAAVSKRTWTSPDGSKKSAWAVRYRDAEGNRRQQTFERKRDANAARHAIEV